MKHLERLKFKFHGAGWATLPPGSTFGPRVLNDYEFLWMVEGESIAEWDGVRYALPPGTLALIPPGTRDYYEWDRSVNTQGVYLHFIMETRGVELPPKKEWPPLRVLPDGDILRPLMRHAMWLVDHHSPAREELLQLTMRQMLGAYLSGDFHTGAAVTTNFPAPVTRALRFAHERLEAGIARAPTLVELARAAHVSEGHLCRLFRTSVGCGPLQALKQVRLDRAASLLAETNLPAKEIAGLFGFASPFHFSRSFRESFGLSPRAYRRRASLGEVVPNTRLRAVRILSRPG